MSGVQRQLVLIESGPLTGTRAIGYTGSAILAGLLRLPPEVAARLGSRYVRAHGCDYSVLVPGPVGFDDFEGVRHEPFGA